MSLAIVLWDIQKHRVFNYNADMKNGYLKVAAASPSLVLANPMDNLG